MTRKEAIRKTLAFEPVRPMPYNFDFTRPMRLKLAEHFGNSDVDQAVGNDWLVSAGLKAGDQVIVDGLQKVRPGAPVKAVPATPLSSEAQPAAASQPSQPQR